MYFVLIALMIGGAVVAFASIINSWEESSNGEPLGRVREDNPCKPHTWRQATFLTHEEYDAHQDDPKHLASRKTAYCSECGLVPSLNKMVKPKYLMLLAQREEAVAAAEARLQDVVELKAQFIEFYLEGLELQDEAQRELVLKGWKAYDRFVGALPELVKAREVAREMKKLG